MTLHLYPVSCILKELQLFPLPTDKRKLILWLSGSQPAINLLPAPTFPHLLILRDVWRCLETYLVTATGMWGTEHPTMHSAATPPPQKKKPKDFPAQTVDNTDQIQS